LVFVEDLKNYNLINWGIISIVFAIAFFSMLYTIEGIFYGLRNQKEGLE